MLTDLSERADVALLVCTFYAKVRKDETLAPIFNTAISDWEPHLEKLTDFWEMQLFGGRTFNGNPIQAHWQADEISGNTISACHFGSWLNLWFQTIDELFSGPNCDLLKYRARKMQTVLMVSIFEHRKQQSPSAN